MLNINLGCFELIREIGRGGFSTVNLVRFKQTGEYFAMKVIDKNFVKRK